MANLWHMRFALQDINNFTDNEAGGYAEHDWPAAYWPGNNGDWDAEVAAFLWERGRMEALVLDPHRDLLAPFPWGSGQTLLREALVAIDHNAHHLGQLIELSRWLESAASWSRSSL